MLTGVYNKLTLCVASKAITVMVFITTYTWYTSGCTVSRW